jgi:branched-subunit amino acid transport protein AzlD
MMTPLQTLILMGALISGTVITRFLPFILFPSNRMTPPYILYLGRVLPYAVMGLLVVFCLKDVSLAIAPHGIPEGLAMLSILGLHIWRKNVLLSIGLGTVIYMALIQNPEWLSLIF